MAKTHLQLVAPTTVKQTVGPQRRPNSDYRTREHLTEAEIEKLIAATKDNRYGHRDANRPRNADVRTREYLTESEVERLIKGCKGNRRPHRDQTMILLAFRHGLRASELCDLQWTQVDFNHARGAVTGVKHGTPSTHPLTGRELRAP